MRDLTASIVRRAEPLCGCEPVREEVGFAFALPLSVGFNVLTQGCILKEIDHKNRSASRDADIARSQSQDFGV